MNDFPTTPLKLITTKIGSGATPLGGQESYKKEGVTLIRSLNVYDLRFEYEGLAHIDDNQAAALSNVEVKPRDILLNITGASVARCCMVPAGVLPARVNQHTAIVRVDESKADPRFVLYCLVSPKYKHHLLALAQGGATREALTKSTIENFEVPSPSPSTQRKIADILSAYDDLIENNTRRIKILEEMAQTIYREWFVNFRFPEHENVEMVETELGLIPEGWEVGELGDIADNIRETTNAGDHLYRLRYVPIDALSTRSLAIRESKPGQEAQSSLVLFRQGDILFGAMRPYLYKLGIAPFDGVTRTTCFVLRSKASHLFCYATMSLFQEDTIQYANNHSRGTTIPYAVWEGSLSKMPIVIPPATLLLEYNRLVRPMLSSIAQSYFRQLNLSQTRDLLLPKLVSGEVEVGSPLIDPES